VFIRSLRERTQNAQLTNERDGICDRSAGMRVDHKKESLSLSVTAETAMFRKLIVVPTTILNLFVFLSAE